MEYNEGNIEKYLEDNDLEIEVIVDEEAALFYYCGVNSYPTSFIISLDGFNQFFDYSMSLYEKTDSGAEE